MKEFKLKLEHIVLLQNANWRWEDMEAGGPAIDCKRPFGNSSYEHDIAELLLWDTDDEESLMEKARDLYRELEYAVQIIMQTPGKEIPLGKYIFDGKLWKIA